MLFRYLVLNFKQTTQYKADFFIGAIPHLCTQVFSVIFFKLILDAIPRIEGWDFNEVLFVYGFSVLAFGLYALFFGNLRNTKYYLFSGEFEIMRLRPISPIKHIIIMSFQSQAIEQMLSGLAIVIYAAIRLKLEISIVSVLAFLYFLGCGTVLLGGISIISVSFLLFTKGTFTPLTAIFAFKEYTKYPLSLFGGVMQFLLTWIIPFGFISYYPSLYFLQRNTFMVIFSGIMAACFFAVGVTLFDIGLKHYEGVSA